MWYDGNTASLLRQPTSCGRNGQLLHHTHASHWQPFRGSAWQLGGLTNANWWACNCQLGVPTGGACQMGELIMLLLVLHSTTLGCRQSMHDLSIP